MGDIVDTNVLLTANGDADHASIDCQEACIDRLLAVKASSSLVLDSGRSVLDEYGKRCSHSGQPGVGDDFFVWAHNNAASLARFDLTPHPDRGYEEFPTDPSLTNFDFDDRIFVALAATDSGLSVIVNAVDSDYSHHAAALTGSGVAVDELCLSELKEA